MSSSQNFCYCWLSATNQYWYMIYKYCSFLPNIVVMTTGKCSDLRTFCWVSYKNIPLNICFSKTLAGYYSKYHDEDGKYDGDVSKRMNFVISDDLVDKINDIFNNIEEKLDIALEDPIYKSEFNQYLKTKIYKTTCFNKKGCNDDHIVPNKNTKYECKPLLQIQSIYYTQEDKKAIFYYPQIRLEQCGYKDFIEYNTAYKDFMFMNSEPESGEEFNDDNDDRDE